MPGSWHVQTMTAGSTEDLEEIENARKTVVINKELKGLQVDIAKFQKNESGIIPQAC